MAIQPSACMCACIRTHLLICMHTCTYMGKCMHAKPTMILSLAWSSIIVIYSHLDVDIKNKMGKRRTGNNDDVGTLQRIATVLWHHTP